VKEGEGGRRREKEREGGRRRRRGGERGGYLLGINKRLILLAKKEETTKLFVSESMASRNKDPTTRYPEITKKISTPMNPPVSVKNNWET
jgi:hypothetical protein